MNIPALLPTIKCRLWDGLMTSFDRTTTQKFETVNSCGTKNLTLSNIGSSLSFLYLSTITGIFDGNWKLVHMDGSYSMSHIYKSLSKLRYYTFALICSTSAFRVWRVFFSLNVKTCCWTVILTFFVGSKRMKWKLKNDQLTRQPINAGDSNDDRPRIGNCPIIVQ